MADWSESLIFAQPINKRQPHSIMEQLKSILRHFDIKRSEYKSNSTLSEDIIGLLGSALHLVQKISYVGVIFL